MQSNDSFKTQGAVEQAHPNIETILLADSQDSVQLIAVVTS